jgi:hypothetical protein
MRLKKLFTTGLGLMTTTTAQIDSATMVEHHWGPSDGGLFSKVPSNKVMPASFLLAQ